MEKVTVSAAALRQVLNALNGPSHYIRELQVTRGPLIGDDNPINILCEEYNAAVKAYNEAQKVCAGGTASEGHNAKLRDAEPASSAERPSQAPGCAPVHLRRTEMEKVTVSAAALRQVLNALNGPSHYIRELQVTRGPLIGDDNPINILCEEYNAAVKAYNEAQKVCAGGTASEGHNPTAKRRVSVRLSARLGLVADAQGLTAHTKPGPQARAL